MSELPQDKIKAVLAAMWQRNQPQILERLALLDQAATAAENDALTPALNAEAVSTAHKLAGTLGTFGYPKATGIARNIEQHLESKSPNPAALRALTKQLRTSLYPRD